MRARTAPIAALMTLAVVAGCSSAPARPSARALIVKIPGCAHPVNQGPPEPADAKQEYSCVARGAIIKLATFSSGRSQRAWISLQGPGNSGCCAEGPDWAATITSIRPEHPIIQSIARRLGGKVVSST
jgi:hypothetical protein